MTANPYPATVARGAIAQMEARIAELEELNAGLQETHKAYSEAVENIGKIGDALADYLRRRGHSLRDTRFRDESFQIMADILRHYETT